MYPLFAVGVSKRFCHEVNAGKSNWLIKCEVVYEWWIKCFAFFNVFGSRLWCFGQLHLRRTFVLQNKPGTSQYFKRKCFTILQILPVFPPCWLMAQPPKWLMPDKPAQSLQAMTASQTAGYQIISTLIQYLLTRKINYTGSVIINSAKLPSSVLNGCFPVLLNNFVTDGEPGPVPLPGWFCGKMVEKFYHALWGMPFHYRVSLFQGCRCFVLLLPANQWRVALPVVLLFFTTA